MSEKTEITVELQGASGLRETHALRGRLQEALETGKTVVIDLRQLTGVDISVLQLLVAARISAAHRGSELRLLGVDGGVFREAAERSGLSEAWQCI